MAESGMECPECGNRHSDWEKVAHGAVDDGHNAGVIDVYECEECGAREEIPKR